MWKFHDFTIAQILREINFGESRSSKTVIFAILVALNSIQLIDFGLEQLQKFIKIIIQSL